MAYEDVLLEKKDGIATITLNVPDKLNALTYKMRKNLPLVTEEIAQDDSIRAVIVTGAGRGFCSGIDLGGMPAELPRNERIQHAGWPFIDAFPKLMKPVIAAVNGVCVGGGLSLALTCDIRIASEAARFGCIWITRALAPDFGSTYLLPRTVGSSKALELMWTGEMLPAAEAARIGIVSKVVPPEELMKTAQELAFKIAHQAPLSIELAKKMVYRSMFDAFTRQLDMETLAQRICSQSEDAKAAVKAFLEKKPQPEFTGK